MERRRTFSLSFLLVIVTLALYWPATNYEFVYVDDNLYVTENPWVAQGLSWANVKWAFTTTHASNWHPLTWLSHMLDYSIFERFAGGHHLTNILLHAINTLLLFLLLKRLTQSVWPSFFVAALFAWHPLHVESVAWVAERKDVLSTLFWILTIWAYARFAEARRLRFKVQSSQSGDEETIRRSMFGVRCSVFFYILALFLFALGLMVKPMLVTLPCVLILLDFWPLKRFPLVSKASDFSPEKSSYAKLLVEKLPFFALSFAACIATVLAQRGALRNLEEVSFSLRLLNSLTAYVDYLSNTFLPVNLCVFYPLPAQISMLSGICAALILAAISYLVFRWRTKFPWMIIGWLWFLGTLVPVIGIVQVGQQARADRYTYIPLIGIFIMISWSADYWLRRRKSPPAFKFGAALILLVSCMLLARNQLAYWRDSLSLFSRAAAVTKDNAFAHQNLGVTFSHAGHPREAIRHFQEALRIKPNHIPTHYNLGIEFAALEKLDEAAAHFSEALRLGSRSEKLHNNLGVVFAKQGQLDSAIDHFKQAIQINPDYPTPYLNHAQASQRLGRAGEAVTNYSKALALDADWPEALLKFAFLLAICPEPEWRNPTVAVKMAERAIEITELRPANHFETLAIIYANAGKYSNAVATAEAARKNARKNGSDAMLERLDRDLELYRAEQRPPRDWKNPL